MSHTYDSFTFNVVQITGRQRVFNAFLIGMISCGITGRIFEPPCSSMSWTPWRAKNSYGCVVSLKKKMLKIWSTTDCTMKSALTKGHQRRVVNSDDNQVFRFQPSMLFCFLLCRVLMQLGNHLVRKIFEMQLVLKYNWLVWWQIGVARESTNGPIRNLPLLRSLKAPAWGGPTTLAFGIWAFIVNPNVSILVMWSPFFFRWSPTAYLQNTNLIFNFEKIQIF